jgi:hypothetical protein
MDPDKRTDMLRLRTQPTGTGKNAEEAPKSDEVTKSNFSLLFRNRDVIAFTSKPSAASLAENLAISDDDFIPAFVIATLIRILREQVNTHLFFLRFMLFLLKLLC